MRETWAWSLGWEDPQRRAWQPTPVFLPGESPWTEEPGELQSMGSQRVGHNWATKDICLLFVWSLSRVLNVSLLLDCPTCSCITVIVFWFFFCDIGWYSLSFLILFICTLSFFPLMRLTIGILTLFFFFSYWFHWSVLSFFWSLLFTFFPGLYYFLPSADFRHCFFFF